MHKYGVPIFTQLYHRGPWAGPYTLAARPVAASPVTLASPFDVREEVPPHELTITEIEELVERFASGAARLQQAGWDGIEVNAGGDHLFATFLSRFWNRRGDKYGPQSMENRTRFVVDVVKEIKKRCGSGFPVQVLMNAGEVGVPTDQGLNLEEAREIARIFESIGVDSLHVRSLGGHAPRSSNMRCSSTPNPTSHSANSPKNSTGAGVGSRPRCRSPKPSSRPCRYLS